jgi:CheY-like chemotaxis protein
MAVDLAYDGLGAAAKITSTPYDVLVLDRDLRGLHGDALCRIVSEREIPAMILMLTAADVRQSGRRTQPRRRRRRRLPLEALSLPRTGAGQGARPLRSR